MKQAILTGIKQMQIVETERPIPGSGQVLVEIEACGICGSDLHIYKGGHPTIKPPVIMGHEFAGKVVEIGPNIEIIKIGDYVVGIPNVGCGICEHCKQG